ncbi:MAG: hypothetical protein PHI52_10055, partial [Bacteroidales bacterium]|nr:hypothetical protein [Bacteroidales bacterium]
MKSLHILIFILGNGFYTQAQERLQVWVGDITPVKEVNDTFKISTASQMAWLYYQGIQFGGKTIFLTNDIDLGGTSNIHPNWRAIRNFEGTFDGNYHKVINYFFKDTLMTVNLQTGFFGPVFETGIVKNVILENIYIYSSATSIGGVAAMSYGLIENCKVSGTIIGTNAQQLHGISGGSANKGTIKNCETRCTFGGEKYYSYYCGSGLGASENIISCLSSCTSTFKGAFGGLAFSATSNIKNCYVVNSHIVKGGGFVFYEYGASNGIAYDSVKNSYIVNTMVDTGGLFGYTEKGGYFDGIRNCYYDSDMGGNPLFYPSIAHNDSVKAKTKADMQESSFVTTLNGNQDTAAWKADFEDMSINDGFPILVWQRHPQYITWIQDVDTLYPGNEVQLTATSSSGLQVDYLIASNYDMVSISADKKLKIANRNLQASVQLIAKQAGDSTYDQAPWVYKTVYIAGQNQIDVKIDTILKPIANECDTSTRTVNVIAIVQNLGMVDKDSVIIHARIDSAGITIANIREQTGFLPAGNVRTHIFSTPYTVPYMDKDGGTYTVTVYIEALSGDIDLHNDTMKVVACEIPHDVSITEKAAKKFEVSQNQPNPTNGNTIIYYCIPQSGKVKLT